MTKEQLILRFIEPYEQGRSIFINGKNIEPVDIERIKITQSEALIESYIQQIRMEDQGGALMLFAGISITGRAMSRTQDVTDDYIAGAPGYKKALTIAPSKANKSGKKPHQVFIVHGRQEAAKVSAARFVEKLGFEAIILHEKASAGRTIIEKIEHYTDVGFAIILYTPDDVGDIKSENIKLKMRARQNVVFEHGYLIGKLGRSNVSALVEGDVELPNDISGVVYVTLDASAAWQLQLAKEMKQCGYDIDMNKLF